LTVGDVTRILAAIDEGEEHASEELLPLVYDELRRLAAHRLSAERRDHTLQPTALVHEAYLRLVDAQSEPTWRGRGHFFGAAAKAMRRILIEHARGRARLKRGGSRRRVGLTSIDVAVDQAPEDLLALDEALGRLAEVDAQAAALVDLRYFAGLTMPQAAQALDVSLRSAERMWTWARTWLFRDLSGEESEGPLA